MALGADSSFSNEIMINRINSDLANGLGNLVSRTVTMADKYFGGTVVGNDYMSAGRRIFNQWRQELPQQGGAVPIENDDCNVGRIGIGGIFRHYMTVAMTSSPLISVRRASTIVLASEMSAFIFTFI